MPLVLYAVVARGDDSPRDVGLQRLDGTEVGVLFEECETAPTRDDTTVLAYGRTLTQLAETATILPMRFGTVLDSAVDLLRTLDERGHEWRERLERIAGHAEMILHVEHGDRHVETPDVPAPRSGRDYLRTRVQAARVRDGAVARLARRLGPWMDEYRVLRGGPDLRLACLVRTSQLAAFEEEASRSADSEGGVLRMTGPWPPFSFTEEPVL